MSEETTAAKNPSVPQPRPAASGDLSREIEQSMERQPDERIRTVRLFDDCYRCNWWVADKTPHPFWLVTGTIRKSRFVRVTKKNDRLQIDDIGSR